MFIHYLCSLWPNEDRKSTSERSQSWHCCCYFYPKVYYNEPSACFSDGVNNQSCMVCTPNWTINSFCPFVSQKKKRKKKNCPYGARTSTWAGWKRSTRKHVLLITAQKTELKVNRVVMLNANKNCKWQPARHEQIEAGKGKKKLWLQENEILALTFNRNLNKRAQTDIEVVCECQLRHPVVQLVK